MTIKELYALKSNLKKEYIQKITMVDKVITEKNKKGIGKKIKSMGRIK